MRRSRRGWRWRPSRESARCRNRPPNMACIRRTRHADRLGPEGAGELPLAVPVTIPFRRTVAPIGAKSARKAGQFLLAPPTAVPGCAGGSETEQFLSINVNIRHGQIRRADFTFKSQTRRKTEI